MDISDSQKNQNSDSLIGLPTDKNQPTHSELKVINSLFKEEKKEKSVLYVSIQYIVLTLIVMLFYFIPNETIKQFLPVALTTNDFIPIFVKSIGVSVTFYMFQNHLYKN